MTNARGWWTYWVSFNAWQPLIKHTATFSRVWSSSASRLCSLAGILTFIYPLLKIEGNRRSLSDLRTTAFSLIGAVSKVCSLSCKRISSWNIPKWFPISSEPTCYRFVLRIWRIVHWMIEWYVSPSDCEEVDYDLYPSTHCTRQEWIRTHLFFQFHL